MPLISNRRFCSGNLRLICKAQLCGAFPPLPDIPKIFWNRRYRRLSWRTRYCARLRVAETLASYPTSSTLLALHHMHQLACIIYSLSFFFLFHSDSLLPLCTIIRKYHISAMAAVTWTRYCSNSKACPNSSQTC